MLVSVPVISSDTTGAKGWLAVDHTDQLRRLAINDARFAEHCLCGAGVDSGELDPKTLELVRLATLASRSRLGRLRCHSSLPDRRPLSRPSAAMAMVKAPASSTPRMA